MIHDPNPPTWIAIDSALAPMRVHILGSGPPAVLWHSLFVDSTTWCRVRDRLSAHRRLILIDGPSHGHSAPVNRRFTLAHCATAAAQVLDRLAINDPVDWVGSAWGGHVGIEFAAAHPHRCRTLTTIGTPVRALTEAERRKIKQLLAVYRFTGPLTLVKTLTRTLLGPGADPEATAIVGDAFRRAPRKGMVTAVRSTSLARPNLTSTLPRVTAPTLFVSGADDDMSPHSEARESARHLPHGAVATLPGAGHLAPLFNDAPRLATLILDFWDHPARFVASPEALETN